MSEIPDDLLYSRQHEWVRMDGNISTVGITDYAQQQLGDLTFVDLPEVDETYEQFTEVGVVESVKAASDVLTPVGGTVIAVNTQLLSHPELVNEDPYGHGWLYRMRHDDEPETEGLLDAQTYDAYLESESE